MRYRILFSLACLLLTSCAPTPQEEIASGYARIAATEQAQVAQRAAQVEQARQATESAMQTSEAAQSEIDLMNAQAHGTLTAIESQSKAIAVGMQSYQATQAAWSDSLHVTETMAPVQATQTAQPTIMAASLQSADAKADQMQVIANVLPFLAMIAVLAMIALTLILVWWIGKRASLDVSGRGMKIEVLDRQNGAMRTPIGILQYRQDASLVDRAKVDYQNLNTVSDIPDIGEIPAMPEIVETPREKIDPLKVEAIKLTSEIVAMRGDGFTQLLGWREIKKINSTWTSGRWQRGRDYLEALQMIEKNGQEWYFVAGAREILYRLSSPTPNVGHENQP